jgi:hypothetical protein
MFSLLKPRRLNKNKGKQKRIKQKILTSIENGKIFKHIKTTRYQKMLINAVE